MENRVIVLTASDQPNNVVKSLRLRAVSYILKSPLPGKILDLVAKFTNTIPHKDQEGDRA
jgi:DNA-binding NarL/FixJ family response regulator